MKSLVVVLLVLGLTSYCFLVEGREANKGQCNYKRSLKPRPHSVSILEFGAVGDGRTLNTVAFENAIYYLTSFADKGGAQLYVPPGRWLTGCFNLTNNLTLFLESGAVILASQDYSHWELVDPLPSYGRGIELPGKRYHSLITGYNLSDVVITGDNGTIDGQGSIWWELFKSHSLNYSRPHLVEFIDSRDIVISNLTFLDSPAWNIHPVYSSNIQIQNITVHAPPESPYTSGIVPDSCEHVCLEDSNITMGYDAIVLKSGWDNYGILYGKPTRDVHIRRVSLQSSSGSALAFGSEMSGGIFGVLTESIHLHHSFTAIKLKTSVGRGGFMKNIIVSDVEMEYVHLAISASGQCGSHPDDKFDPHDLPAIDSITFRNIVGKNVTIAGNFSGIEESPFTSICLSNISLLVDSDPSKSWVCSNVSGFYDNVSPKPCSNFISSSLSSSSASLSILDPNNLVSAI